ncbi:S-layer homology domain-containing protein [Paenibacillus qinlingensis]|uniref:S-layer homology domain-containing protein n=1 Tax=Paenibacillus qinlingensis TaxID=1837343 RepID=UPI00156771B5|nr:S-layer homology domain-containing protein [Paenibacillus qinlingensis]NQX63019.1 S-layer homology domain-containing protein [Paenibacillus qinlingensis]
MYPLWKKTYLLLTASALLLTGVAVGGSRADAEADIRSMSLRPIGGDYEHRLQYVTAEVPFVIMYDTTKVVSTTSTDTLFYSRDNGVSWIPLTRGQGGALTLPIDASLTSVRFRIHAWFDPLVGSNSEDDYVSAPYSVKQPGAPTDVKATANSNGSVTLTWLDNSNMESRYDITRSGPDGKKTFTFSGKTDSIGQVSYVDTQTSKTNNTWYVYQIKPIIDQYAIPEYLVPGEAVTIVESTPPLGQIKDIQIDAPLLKGSGIQPILKPGKTTLNILDDIARITVSSDLISKVDGVITNVPDIFAGASSWALPELKQAFGLGLTTSETMSKYTEAITREDFAGLAIRLYEKLTGKTVAPDYNPVFKDTNNVQVNQAYRLGIVNGLTNDTFGPKNPITRQEMSVMLLRTVRLAKSGVALDTTTKMTFSDSSSISSWAQDAMNFVVNYGIMNGVAGNKLDPHGNTTREQAILLSLRTYLATAVLH